MNSERKAMLEMLEKRPIMILARKKTPKLFFDFVAWLDTKRGEKACKNHIERIMCDCTAFEANEYAFLERFLNEDYTVSVENCIKVKGTNNQASDFIKNENINSVKQNIRAERKTLSNKIKKENEYKNDIELLIECDEFISTAKSIVAERIIAARKYTEEYICNYIRMLKGIDIDISELNFSNMALEHFEAVHTENDKTRKDVIKSLRQKEN